MPARDPAQLAEAVAASDKRAVADALNLVEDRRPASRADVGALLHALAGSARAAAGHRVGLTGPPGVGKSTLGSALARELRARGRTVGVIAVDPSSTRSRGALLGDRARMAFDPADAGLFVRSLATGGEAGGLAYAANAATRVLAAAFDVVLLETTGVGQTETDVADVADTVVLVIQPGSGDVLQFLKAGVMEIPDVLVVNKADQEALARRAVNDLRSALATARAVGAEVGAAGFATPIVATSARDETGIDALCDALDRHRAHLAPTLQEKRRAGDAAWAISLFRRRHGEHGVTAMGGPGPLRELVLRHLSGGMSPLGVAETLSEAYLARETTPGRDT